MSTDLKLFPDATGQTYGIRVGTEGDFVSDEGLETQVLVSVLTDARADSSEVAIPEDRSGWMGNLNFPTEGRSLGSILWTLQQAKRTTASKNRAIDYVQKSLDWFAEDEIAKSITVSGELTASGVLLNIQIVSLSGVVDNVYVPLWGKTING